MKDIRNNKAKHSYSVEVGIRFQSITVDADTRSQAAKIAKQNGYAVRSVNMIG